jgi:hypothetical protein
LKTGRLLKFQRAGAEIHAYLYREGSEFRAAVYEMSRGAGLPNRKVHSIDAPTEEEAEAAVRRWVTSHFPGQA